MNTIWKLKIPDASHEFPAPAGGKAIYVTVQQYADGVQPILYLLCSTVAPPAKHRVSMFGTGQQIPDDIGDYVGTISIALGGPNPAVLHVFHRQLSIELAS